MTDIYADEIVAHYEHPHNKGKLADATVSFREYNPICGDDITVYLKTDNETVKDIKFDGTGCAISIGSASMLTDKLKGKQVSLIAKMGAHDVIDMLGLDPGPARLKCATLALKAVQKAISSKQ